MLDSSATLTFEDALKIGFKLDELKYEWFEEPFFDTYTLQLRIIRYGYKKTAVITNLLIL